MVVKNGDESHGTQENITLNKSNQQVARKNLWGKTNQLN